MERPKASFLLAGWMVAGLALGLLSARKPVAGGEAAVTAVPGVHGGADAADAVTAVAGVHRLADAANAVTDSVRVHGLGVVTTSVRAGEAATGEQGGVEPVAVHGTGSAISWMSVEQAAGRLEQEKRPVLIDLYTTWCGWCRQMDKKTYSNKQVAQYLQEKFYTVKVDAETHAAISWQGKTYQFNPQYRSNEFALYLTHGRLEFPTTIIIPPGEEPQAIPGYLEPKDLELLVKYFGEGAYRTQSFDAYQKSFKASW